MIPSPTPMPYLPKYYAVLTGIVLLLVGYMCIELFANKRFSVVDFEVYHRAAGRLWQSEDLYRPGELSEGGDGHFRYKYAPTAALYFLPLAALPLKAAGILYWLLLSGVLVALLHALVRHAFPRQYAIPAYRLPLIPLLAAGAVGVHIELELHLGQVNLLLAYAYMALFMGYAEQKPHRWLSLLWAATLFVKPYALVFLPYFIWYRQGRLLQGLVFWTIILALAPLLFYGDWELWREQHRAWGQELLIQLQSKQTLNAEGVHTIFSLAVRYTPLRWLPIDQAAWGKALVQLGILSGTALSWYYALRRHPFGMRSGQLLHGMLLTAWIPLLAQTDKNAYIFALPAVVALLLYWRSLAFGWKLTAALSIFLCGFNIRDLWGRAWAEYWDQLSLVAVGGLGIALSLTALLVVPGQLPKRV